jgi:predicted transcriptional regulator
MPDIVSKLKECEKKIRSLQQEKAKQEGRRQQLMNQLKETFGIDSIEQAVEELGKLQTGVENNEANLKKIISNMEDIINGSKPK